VSNIEHFWRKIPDASGVKNCKLFEGVSPSSCNLARRVLNPKIACGASKIRLFTSSSNWVYRTSGKDREKDVGKKAKGDLDPETA